jgi:D-alanyl-D-alanine carboxypeptidase (penicillin-binding protein 5/6)
MTKKDQHTKEETTRKALSLGVSFTLMFLAFFFIPQKITPSAEQVVAEQEAIQEVAKQTIIQSLDLEAKAFIAYDINSGKILFSKNEEKVLPLASITKIMTVLTASELAKSDTKISTGDSDQTGTGVINPRENWSLKKIADLTLVSSSNFGAQSIASVIGATTGTNFVSEMNKEAKAIGLTNTSFSNETGLDVNAIISGASGSAFDVAKLFTYILKNKPEIFEATKLKMITETSLNNRNHTATNTNEIVGEIPGLLASKTGLTDLAGGNLAIIANLGLRRPVAFVVMGSSETGRFTDT